MTKQEERPYRWASEITNGDLVRFIWDYAAGERIVRVGLVTAGGGMRDGTMVTIAYLGTRRVDGTARTLTDSVRVTAILERLPAVGGEEQHA